MYESPIELIYDKWHTELAKEIDNTIFRAVQNVGVNVDKEELIKALEYDRDQYSKGYQDALNERLKWTPVEDGLPEEGQIVLVWYEYFRYGNYNCMWQTYGISHVYRGIWMGDVQGTDARCIAWCELPTPYESEK